MANSNDPKEIASRYLDLWLDHWERSARDPEAVDALTRMVQEAVNESTDFHRRASTGLSAMWPNLLAAPFGPWAEMMQHGAGQTQTENDGKPDTTQPEQPEQHGAASTRTDGPTPSGPASGVGSERVAQLLQRITELESRIEHLEHAGDPAASSKPKRPASARRPKKPGRPKNTG